MKRVRYVSAMVLVAAACSVDGSSSVYFDYDNQDEWKNIAFEAPVQNQCGGSANSPIDVPAKIAARCTNARKAIQVTVSRSPRSHGCSLGFPKMYSLLYSFWSFSALHELVLSRVGWKLHPGRLEIHIQQSRRGRGVCWTLH